MCICVCVNMCICMYVFMYICGGKPCALHMYNIHTYMYVRT